MSLTLVLRFWTWRWNKCSLLQIENAFFSPKLTSRVIYVYLLLYRFSSFSFFFHFHLYIHLRFLLIYHRETHNVFDCCLQSRSQRRDHTTHIRTPDPRMAPPLSLQAKRWRTIIVTLPIMGATSRELFVMDNGTGGLTLCSDPVPTSRSG